ncbi:alanine and glycine-rich protein-like [Triticum dicoccoides]|uniref:alanine and glycine-rich protein-like n=1 Tax=Triticum dicoccoides TaxID=85692 RepID=UPI0018905971|nr:alanine and glycine-rich protein-like [Triticum dicoccoides]
MRTITCSNCGLQGHKYTSCLKQLKPELALRKNKHVPAARNSQGRGVAPTAPAATPRAASATPRAPTPTTRAPAQTPRAGRIGSAAGTGGGSGAGRGAGRTGGGRGFGRASSSAQYSAGRCAHSSRPFSTPRQYGASTSSAPPPTDGTHIGWMA